MVKTIVIEGLIGAGKTSLLQILEKEFPNACCVYEPVDLWKESGELEIFYNSLKNENPSVWAYRFQTYAFITRVMSIKKAVKENPDVTIFFLERSIFSDKHFFIEMLHDTGVLNDRDYEMYNNWWEIWADTIPISPDGFIYLSPDLNECMKRLTNRNRSEETGVSIEYQEKLKQAHDNFLTEKVTVNEKIVPCFKINNNEDFRKNYTTLLSQIQDFVGTI